MSDTLTPEQMKLARHALGLPNKQNTSYRNRFCTGKDCPDHAVWEEMVAAGFAKKVTGTVWGGDDMFLLTLKGALLARNNKEHLSQEDTRQMRKMEGA